MRDDLHFQLDRCNAVTVIVFFSQPVVNNVVSDNYCIHETHGDRHVKKKKCYLRITSKLFCVPELHDCHNTYLQKFGFAQLIVNLDNLQL